MIDEVRSTRLPNGITVLTEHMPGLRSVTAGIWGRRGPRQGTPELNGICHFIEHAVFKGTHRRTARDIAVESDRLGGHLDAFTTHEMTGFAVKVADRSLPEAFDLLADLLAHPRFDQNDLEREQKVILEEMKMVEDTPDELLGELFNAAYFPGHPLGRPIEGTESTVSSFDHNTISTYHAQEFSVANLVVASAVGGGTSSRLWQTIREERGLAYSVGAGGSTFSDVGVFTIYAGTSPEHLDEVLDLSLDEMRRVVAESVPEEELKLAKDQAISSILLGLESSRVRVR